MTDAPIDVAVVITLLGVLLALAFFAALWPLDRY